MLENHAAARGQITPVLIGPALRDILAHPWRSLFELATIVALFFAGAMILIMVGVAAGAPL
jgi:hypothetical protein